MPVQRAEAPIKTARAAAYRIPTDQPEADGTLAWEATTLVVAEVEAGGQSGLGFTYADASNVSLIQGVLADAIRTVDAFDPPRAWEAMRHAVRNLGREGLAATAISAVDLALWDLKAKLLGLPLALLLGRQRDEIPIYGSGGFTNYSDDRLKAQLGGWVNEAGCHAVKMKVGAEPEGDGRRVEAARSAIGGAQLFVDANGALSAKQALRFAALISESDVRWFEEPVSSDDLSGLALVRAQTPAGMDVAAGEYAYTPDYVETMLAAGAVDCQQADVTRIGGVTGFLRAAALCDAHHIDLSGHCAPAMHLHVACAAPRLRHLEWFHDHARIERLLFDGAPTPEGGVIRPSLDRPGHGLGFRVADAVRYAISGGS